MSSNDKVKLQDSLIDKIYDKISEFEMRDLPAFTSNGVNPLLAVLDFLELLSDKEKYADVVYRIRGGCVVDRRIVNEVTKLEKKYANFLD